VLDDTELTGRNWGILKIAGHASFVRSMIETFLPPGHRIVATRQAPDDLLDLEYIVEGPDMPLVFTKQEAPRKVEIEFVAGYDGVWCYWKHMDWKRWEAHHGGNNFGD